MRDEKRIIDFSNEFSKIWKEKFPDWRFGQLCSNFFGWLATEKKIDLFFPEENKMLEYFKEYAGYKTEKKWSLWCDYYSDALEMWMKYRENGKKVQVGYSDNKGNIIVKASSSCNPLDNFDLEIGRNIAELRCVKRKTIKDIYEFMELYAKIDNLYDEMLKEK